MDAMTFHCIVAKSSDLKRKFRKDRKLKSQQKKSEIAQMEEKKAHFYLGCFFFYKGFIKFHIIDRYVLRSLIYPFSLALLSKIRSKYALLLLM